MLTSPKNTLAYHRSRALSQHRDMRDVPLHYVTAAVQKGFPGSQVKAQPETDALWFYGMNHAVSLIAERRAPLEPLPKEELELVDKYYTEIPARAVRAFYYLLLICTREARHNKSLSSSMPAMITKFGQQCAWFFKLSGGESAIHTKLLETPPDTTIGNYVNCVRWQFYNCSWSSGYGGKAWGAVTDCLVRFVEGEYSAEIMLDTSFTLAHNNGPIHNKSIYYNMYTHNLLRVLDVQRSGQVPEGVLHDAALGGFVEAGLATAMAKLRALFPDRIGKYVCWLKVKALGGVGNYTKDIEQQKLAGHMGPEIMAQMKAQEAAAKAAVEAKAKAAAEAAALAKAQHEKNYLTIMPGVEIKKFERQAA